MTSQTTIRTHSTVVTEQMSTHGTAVIGLSTHGTAARSPAVIERMMSYALIGRFKFLQKSCALNGPSKSVEKRA